MPEQIYTKQSNEFKFDIINYQIPNLYSRCIDNPLINDINFLNYTYFYNAKKLVKEYDNIVKEDTKFTNLGYYKLFFNDTVNSTLTFEYENDNIDMDKIKDLSIRQYITINYESLTNDSKKGGLFVIKTTTNFPVINNFKLVLILIFDSKLDSSTLRNNKKELKDLKLNFALIKDPELYK